MEPALSTAPLETPRKSPRATRKTTATTATRRGSTSSEPLDRDSSSEDHKKVGCALDLRASAGFGVESNGPTLLQSTEPRTQSASPSPSPGPGPGPGPSALQASPPAPETKAPGKLSTRVLEKEKEERRKRNAERKDTEPSEPTMMICPETGLLIPMQEAEEGQYVPISNASGVAQDKLVATAAGGSAGGPAQVMHPPIIKVSFTYPFIGLLLSISPCSETNLVLI